MNYRAWQVGRPNEEQAKRLAQAIGASNLLARVLVARGVTEPARAMRMLTDDEPLSDPFLLKDMDKAVARIEQAVEQEEPLVIYGDYDVDGLTATALLYSHLTNMGASVRCMLPSREGEGYGLNVSMLEKLAAKGYRLVVTVDNGISALAEAAWARELGMDLVITDHHLPGDTLPDAVAVVDPKRRDDTSPFKDLCGAGVAYKLCAALDGCDPADLADLCSDLAAVGTVADAMPLTGENRTLVKAGLRNLQNTDRPGLAALMEAAGLGEKPVTAENISYGLAPRLNAAGRMGSAATALRLLLCEEEDQARELAQRLSRINEERQAEEHKIMERVEAMLAADPARTRDRVLLVWDEGYHSGVIGIVASRLVERYNRPAIVITLQDGEGRGSGRSVEGFDLHEALKACGDLLLRYGGHTMAAGLSVKAENLEALRRRINEWAAQNHPVLSRAPLQLDVPVRLQELTVAEVEGLDYLTPCGNGNPAPLFLVEDALLDGVYPIGNGRHCRLRLRQGNGTLYAALFGTVPEQLAYQPGDHVDVAVSLNVFEGRSGKQLSGRIHALRPAGLGETVSEQAALYEAFSAGAQPNAAWRSLLTPPRENTIALYRLIREGKVRGEDLQPLFALLGPQNTGKTLVSLEALTQLGLVGLQQEDGVSRYVPLPAAQKKNLTDAPILKRLENSGGKP